MARSLPRSDHIQVQELQIDVLVGTKAAEVPAAWTRASRSADEARSLGVDLSCPALKLPVRALQWGHHSGRRDRLL
jgi:hypothetical protein